MLLGLGTSDIVGRMPGAAESLFDGRDQDISEMLDALKDTELPLSQKDTAQSAYCSPFGANLCTGPFSKRRKNLGVSSLPADGVAMWKCPVPACRFGYRRKYDKNSETSYQAARVKINSVKSAHVAKHRRGLGIPAEAEMKDLRCA